MKNGAKIDYTDFLEDKIDQTSDRNKMLPKITNETSASM